MAGRHRKNQIGDLVLVQTVYQQYVARITAYDGTVYDGVKQKRRENQDAQFEDAGTPVMFKQENIIETLIPA